MAIQQEEKATGLRFEEQQGWHDAEGGECGDQDWIAFPDTDPQPLVGCDGIEQLQRDVQHEEIVDASLLRRHSTCVPRALGPDNARLWLVDDAVVLERRNLVGGVTEDIGEHVVSVFP